jgi:ubiquinone/menaquinone biosynthesis C-methylase UbiE
MLSRQLEPEVMDAADEARDYDAMDHTEVNRVFVTDLLAAGLLERATEASTADDETADLELLDLGTGTALIPIELCRRASGVRVLGVDLAASMLDLARGNVEVAGLTRRIALDLVDAKGLPYADGRFGAVMSNSIVHHIPEPAAVLAEGCRVLAAGGLIFVRDLLRPQTEDDVSRLVLTYTGGENEHQRTMFANSLRAALTLDEIRSLVADLGFAADTVRQTSDRHWTWSSRKQ